MAHRKWFRGTVCSAATTAWALLAFAPTHAADLPDASAFSPELMAAIAARVTRLDAGREIRSSHIDADGLPLYTNRLILESSPYLLQHAHNPVNWYPWGEEALALARAENKPILLSVGYSTCHWCHVMEAESFDNIEIASFLNRHYIAIKVDREERPDIDSIYMAALQAINGRGGWPMTMWLTPSGEPFFGDSYIPPFDGDRGVRQGFMTLLSTLADTYRSNSEQVGRVSERLMAAVSARVLPKNGSSLPTDRIFETAFDAIASRFDTDHGGLDVAPKFPGHLPARFLLRYRDRSGGTSALNMVSLTLRAMASGGIFDQVGGGFHRYATDDAWRMPHFEKMLYDNAQLALIYLEAFLATRDPEYEWIVRDVLQFIYRDLQSPQGGFYTAVDADSRSESGDMREGWYYSWPEGELHASLDSAELALLRKRYGTVDIAGRQIFYVRTNLADLADSMGVNTAVARDALQAVRQKLAGIRAGRTRPFVDEKIITSINAMTISAYARASLALQDRQFLEIAHRAARFVDTNLTRDGVLYRSYLAGSATGTAFADDHAFLAQAYLDLYEAGGDIEWFDKAVEIDRRMAALFEDESGGFFYTPSGSSDLPIREKPVFDASTPSANAVAAMNLLRLHEYTGDDSYRRRAEKALTYFSDSIGRAPAAAPSMLAAFDFFDRGAKEIVIVTAGERQDARAFLDELYAQYLPNHVLAVVGDGDDVLRQASSIPLLEGKRAILGQTTAYVCEQGICDLPTQDAAVFAEQLRSRGDMR